RVPRPGEHQLPGAAGGDHLVVDEIGREPAEREVPPPLPDDLVPRREADEVGEALDHHRVAVADVRRDGLPHGGDLGRRGGGAQAISLSRASIIARAVSMSSAPTTSGGASRSVLLPAPSRSRPCWKAPCTRRSTM